MQRGRLRGASRSPVEIDDSPSFAGLLSQISWWNPYFHHMFMVKSLFSPHFDGSMPIFTTFWWFNAYFHHILTVQCLFSSHVQGKIPIFITCSWFNAFFHHILMVQCLFSSHVHGDIFTSQCCHHRWPRRDDFVGKAVSKALKVLPIRCAGFFSWEKSWVQDGLCMLVKDV